MRKKTAIQTTKRRTGSSPKQSGLITKGKNPQRSATTKSALGNRSHRMPWRSAAAAKRPSGCIGLLSGILQNSVDVTEQTFKAVQRFIQLWQ